MFITQALSAIAPCQDAVAKAAMNRLSNALSVCNSDTEVYCQGRQRLPLKLVQRMIQKTGQTILCPKEALNSELGELYKDRWHKELDIRNIKPTLVSNREFSNAGPNHILWCFSVLGPRGSANGGARCPAARRP